MWIEVTATFLYSYIDHIVLFTNHIVAFAMSFELGILTGRLEVRVGGMGVAGSGEVGS